MEFLAKLLILALDIYVYIIIASVVVSWLIVFDVINARHPQAQNLLRLLDKATEPVFSRLRRFIPPLGGIDITPIIVILVIYLLQRLIAQLFLM